MGATTHTRNGNSWRRDNRAGFFRFRLQYNLQNPSVYAFCAHW